MSRMPEWIDALVRMGAHSTPGPWEAGDAGEIVEDDGELIANCTPEDQEFIIALRNNFPRMVNFMRNLEAEVRHHRLQEDLLRAWAEDVKVEVLEMAAAWSGLKEKLGFGGDFGAKLEMLERYFNTPHTPQVRSVEGRPPNEEP